MGTADEEYRVLVTYTSGGDISGHLKDAKGHAEGLGHAISEIGHGAEQIGGSLVHAMQHAVEHAAHLVAHMAKVGLAAGIAGAAYGVGHLNNELEQTQISLAAIFKGQGLAGDFTNAFNMAGDQITKMKHDIKTLPGDLGQLSNVMLQIASPLANAGKGADDIRQMAGKTMLASQILLGAKYGEAAQEIGAREMTMLLQGNFGAKNSWAMEMPGMQQYKSQWKGMSEEKRLEIVSAKIDNLVKDAGGKFAMSFVANWTTLKDNFKYGLLAPATQPLFEHVKHSMARVNTWFDDNPAKVKAFTDKLGDGLAHAWDRGVEIAEEWWPKIISFAHELHTELSDIWEKYAPALQEAATAIKMALGDGSAVKDIKEILGLYAASKVGGAGLNLAAGGVKLGAGLSQIAAGAGPEAAAAIPVVGGAIAVIVTAFAAAAAGELHAIADVNSKNHDDAEAAAKQLHDASGRFTQQLETDTMPALEKFGVGLTKFAAWMLDPKSINWAAWVDPSASEADKAAQKEFDESARMDAAADAAHRAGSGRNIEEHAAINWLRGSGGNQKSVAEQYKDLYAAQAKKGAGHGAGGTHVQKVEIVVNTNQDSNRVAEAVVRKIENLPRHPKVSSMVPNYSGR